jgi:N-acetylmuramoyl-L-alanine amidase
VPIDIDNLPTVGPAKWQRATRRLGGSASTTPDRPRLIVLHTIESPELSGQAQMTAVWMRDNGTYGTEIVSSHVAADDLGVIRCVEDGAVAFTCGTPWNDCSLNIEMSGRAAQQDGDWRDPYSTALREHVAQLTAAWCDRHGRGLLRLD